MNPRPTAYKAGALTTELLPYNKKAPSFLTGLFIIYNSLPVRRYMPPLIAIAAILIVLTVLNIILSFFSVLLITLLFFKKYRIFSTFII